MQKLILANYQAPGDVVMLTAAVRDLHRCYPGQFITHVETDYSQLWENNPYLTRLDNRDPDVRVIKCGYPLINLSNRRPVHFVHGFIDDLNEKLGLNIQPTRIAGDIHLSDEEKNRPSLIEEMTGEPVPYWTIVAGGKFDCTIKWWHIRRWQAVVEQLRDRFLFVQVGAQQHYHPALKGVLDLRRLTSIRDLVRLVYHAQGVLCPVTFLMHLAAAVETKPGAPSPRPCVVVAGGREPATWEAYPGHRFLHTIGMLPCCDTGGCWRNRSVPLGDGKDTPHRLCVDTVNNLPRCMHMITPEQVVEAVNSYFTPLNKTRIAAHVEPNGIEVPDCASTLQGHKTAERNVAAPHTDLLTTP